MPEDLTVRAVERTLELLNQFSVDRPALGVSELARMTGMYKGTVYRLMLTLQQSGFVQQDPETQRYRLGLALFQLGSIVQADMDVRRIALPHMRILAQQCQETVNLNVVSGLNRVCVECVETSRTVRFFIQAGYTGPLTRAASGKVLLAYLPHGQREAVIMSLTPDERISLQADLETIRRQGYGISLGERIAEAASISAPVLDHTGTTAASLTISGPKVRFTPDKIEAFKVLVKESADQISAQLGHRRH